MSSTQAEVQYVCIGPGRPKKTGNSCPPQQKVERFVAHFPDRSFWLCQKNSKATENRIFMCRVESSELTLRFVCAHPHCSQNYLAFGIAIVDKATARCPQNQPLNSNQLAQD